MAVTGIGPLRVGLGTEAPNAQAASTATAMTTGESFMWKALALAQSIRKARVLLHGRTTVLNHDFEKVIALADERSFIYADPPYYKAGNQLFTKYNMKERSRNTHAIRNSCAPSLLGKPLSIFKPSRSHSPENAAANVRQVGNTACLHICYGSGI